MPAKRKTRYDAATKWALDSSQKEIRELLEDNPEFEGVDILHKWLFLAFIAGYERAKREVRRAS